MRRTWRPGVVAAVSLVLALAAGPRFAQASETRTGPALLGPGSPGRSTVPHLSSRLAALAVRPDESREVQSRITGTPVSGAGSLLRQSGRDRLLVEIRVARPDRAAVARLRAAGAVITHRTVALRTITAGVSPADLIALSRVRGVQYIGEILTPMANAVCDSTISEGDQILHAVQERTHAGVDGTGVTVGILSDSFGTRASPTTTAAQDVASDNLPGATNTCLHTTDVDVHRDYPGPTDPTPEDEGRAMAQIVHDLAPGAKILFATAEGGPDVFAANIRDLATAGADIIVDDFTYFNEPVYQDGVIAKAVNDVRAMGVDYFSSAANNNITVGGHDIASYEAVGGYRPTTCPAVISVAYTDCHNFTATGTDPTYGLSTATNRTIFVTLDWAEPQFGVKTDLALCILNGNGSLAFCVDDRNPGAGGSQQAVEVAGINTNGGTSLQLVVARFGGNNPNENATPRFKLTFLTNGSGAVTNSEYTTPTGTDAIGPSIFGHNGTSGAVSVAASDVRVTSPSTVESYSSHGPVTLLFGPVDGTTAAAALAHPKVLAKPDLTASDCAVNTFFPSLGIDGKFRFCGTSAAAPHTAAVAALLLEQNPNLTPAQLNSALTATAADLGLAARTQGTGLVDGVRAGAAVVPPTVKTNSLPSGVVAKPYSASLHFTRGDPPVTWAVQSGKLPGGLKLAKSGVISGTPTKAGTFHFTVSVTNSVSPKLHATKALSIKIAPIAVRTSALPKGVVGKKYAAALKAYGGTAPLSWKITSGKLPGGLSLARSGAISGKPVKAGTFRFTVQVTDAAQHRASRQLAIVVTRH